MCKLILWSNKHFCHVCEHCTVSLPLMNVKHELMKMNSSLALDRTTMKENIRHQRFSCTHPSIDINPAPHFERITNNWKEQFIFVSIQLYLNCSDLQTLHANHNCHEAQIRVHCHPVTERRRGLMSHLTYLLFMITNIYGLSTGLPIIKNSNKTKSRHQQREYQALASLTTYIPLRSHLRSAQSHS
jgi:hypothetical protein